MEKELLKTYKDILDKKAEIQEEIKKKRNDFETSMVSLYAKQSELNSEILCLENQIEESAISEFYKTHAKKLSGGIGIQERKVITYDEKLAFDWAKKHQLCLSLDNKSFEKLAESQEFSFVKIDKDIKVTFPKEIKIDD